MSKLFNQPRRDVIKTTGIAAGALAAPMFFSRHAWGAEYLNAPTGKTVTLGFNVPQSGAYADEGADELRAYELAVEHLNGGGDGGMMNTLKPSVVMITGGSSSGVAVAVQGLCQEAGIIFMAGLTHSNDTTGKDRKRNGFRHFFNAYMSGQALAPVLGKAYGTDRRAYHLTADYTWGWTQEQSIKDATEKLGWKTVQTVKTPVGAGDFSQYITPVLNSGADVLILNHYGKDMINSLTQAVQFGLRDKQVNGKDFQIVVPLYSRLMAQGAGDNVKGIYGSTNWHWSLQDEGSKAFVTSFGKKYGFPPSQAAHTCYVQALLYADACERAGTFNPCEVVTALEGFKFDGMGNGPTEYRADDHQCFKDVLVVQGNDKPSSKFDVLKVVEVTPRAQVEYKADIAEFKGDLGPCNSGA